VLVAIDMESQQIVWQAPLGSAEKFGPLPAPFTFGRPKRGPFLPAVG